MPLPIPALTERQLARFHAAVPPTASGCWEWRRARNRYGYGVFSLTGRQYVAHRIAYAVHTGSDPGELMVCHSCDNPPCVNPAHLWLGTALDNILDARAKGRSVRRSEYCVKCGHHRIDDIPARSTAPARCRQCYSTSKNAQRRAQRLAARKG